MFNKWHSFALFCDVQIDKLKRCLYTCQWMSPITHWCYTLPTYYWCIQRGEIKCENQSSFILMIMYYFIMTTCALTSRKWYISTFIQQQNMLILSIWLQKMEYCTIHCMSCKVPLLVWWCSCMNSHVISDTLTPGLVTVSLVQCWVLLLSQALLQDTSDKWECLPPLV